MAHRFVVNTVYGIQNFLKIRETPHGDLIISERSRHEPLDFKDGKWDELTPDPDPDPDELINTHITIHPNLNSPNGTITINYKSVINGKEVSREATSAFEVKNGMRLFPVLTSVGGSIAGSKMTVDTKNNTKDDFIELWKGQEFDWSIQSLGYSLFVANKDLSFIFPQEFPFSVYICRYKHLQLIFMYWPIDKPTKGAGISSELTVPQGQAGLGLFIDEAVDHIHKTIQSYLDMYDGLPNFVPAQLPAKFLPQSGVKVIAGKWHFKNPVFAVESHRDESLLRLKFINATTGNNAVIDINGEDITTFQKFVNDAINTNPGLAIWKK